MGNNGIVIILWFLSFGRPFGSANYKTVSRCFIKEVCIWVQIGSQAYEKKNIKLYNICLENWLLIVNDF